MLNAFFHYSFIQKIQPSASNISPWELTQMIPPEPENKNHLHYFQKIYTHDNFSFY